MAKKTNHIQSAMRYHKIVFLIMSCLVVLGFYSMTQMNKDEFPQFTIRQGVVAAVYPGASAMEVEEQVTKPLENFLFTYAEVDKEKTRSAYDSNSRGVRSDDSTANSMEEVLPKSSTTTISSTPAGKEVFLNKVSPCLIFDHTSSLFCTLMRSSTKI